MDPVVKEEAFDFIDELNNFWDKYGDTDIVRYDTLAYDVIAIQEKFNTLSPSSKQDVFVFMLGKVSGLLDLPR